MGREVIMQIHSPAGRFWFAAVELTDVQLVSGIDDAFMLRRRELLRAQGRRRLAVLLAIVAVIVALGGYKLLSMSSAFAVTQVEVTGARPQLSRDIRAAVESVAGGRNLLQVDRDAISSRLLEMPYVRSVSIDRAFPHTLAVRVVVERPAVLVMAGKTGYLVSDDGRVLEQTTATPAGLPQVTMAGTTLFTVGRDTGDDGVRAALAVLAATPPGFRHGVGRITRLIPSQGTIAVVVGDHIHLRLGDTSQLSLKLEVVRRVMRRIQGAQRKELSYIDVTAPSRPAFGMRSTLTSSTG
jgi:cell division protein FtsQ